MDVIRREKIEEWQGSGIKAYLAQVPISTFNALTISFHVLIARWFSYGRSLPPNMIVGHDREFDTRPSYQDFLPPGGLTSGSGGNP